MYQELLDKKKKLAVIGLGYVGLPIALEFARKISVVGFDISEERIDMMKNKVDPSKELEAKDFEDTDILFTANPEDLKQASFFIIAVPTPVDSHNVPNLGPVLSASKAVGKALKKGDYVVYESTVYPGCTEEDCVPVLEEHSGLKFCEDFKVGFSPERINPGDKEHTLPKILKVISGCDEESVEMIARVYEIVVKAGVHKASSIKVAEAAKIIENTQRDVNIALMNELSKIFDRLDINTYEVLEAAGTKWNFLKFSPGLVGGHCIGVDPYYLTYKSIELGYEPEVILSGRNINDTMAKYVATSLVQKLSGKSKVLKNCRVLVMGTTFKENVSDIRNSKVADLIHELQSFNVDVDVIDSYASHDEVLEEYGYGLADGPKGVYDAIILAVNHDTYSNLNESYFKGFSNGDGILFDLKGIYRNQIKEMAYWSL